MPGRGDGTFGAALGPATNLKTMRWITGANMVGGAGADLIGVSGKQLVVVANRDTFELGAPIDTGVSFAGMDTILNAGDVNRDGFGDVLTRDGSGQLWLFAGNGTGALAAGTVISQGWAPVQGLRAVGDVTGDGLPDLIGTPAGGALMVWPGNGSGFSAAVAVKGGVVPSRAGLPSDLSGFDWVLGVQAMTLKGSGDYIVRDRASGVRTSTPAASPASPTRVCWARDWGPSTWPGDRLPAKSDQARAVARSASWTSSRRAGSGLRTRTSEPPRPRGSVKVAIPGGEAGSATERRRPPSVRTLPTAAVLSCVQSRAWVRSSVARSSPVGGSHAVKPSGCDQISTPTSSTPAGSASANRTPIGRRLHASTGIDRRAGCPRVQPVGSAHDGVRVVGGGDAQADRPRGAQEDR